MLAITIRRERTGHWTRMRRSLARSSRSDASCHTPWLAGCITNTSGFKFSARTGAGVDDLNLQSETACSFGYLSQRGLGIRRIGRIDQHGNSNRFGHQVVQEPQPLGHKFSEENIDAGSYCLPAEQGWRPAPA